MSIVLPANYSYCLLAVSLVGLECFLTGFTIPLKARRQFFNKEFMSQFQEVHKQATGEDKAPGAGYPDMGSGFYAQKLSYKDWYEFNLAQRAHYNQVENIGIVVPAILIGGIKFPKVSAILGGVYVLGRFFYSQGYLKGASQREAGAILSHGSNLALIATSIISALKLVLKK